MSHKAIRNIYPNTTTIDGDYPDCIVWDADSNVITLDYDKVDQEIYRLEQHNQSLQYQRLRAPEYPAIGDQLDALFHAGVFPPEMAAKIQAVKDKYPKG